MMNPKALFYWFYQLGYDYNLFMQEENDYDEDDNDEPRDPATIIKHQKYTTWLYVLLLMGKKDTIFSFLEYTFTNELLTKFY